MTVALCLPLTVELAAVLAFIMSSPELQTNRIIDDEDKNKSSTELGQPEPLLVVNKKMKIYATASIAVKLNVGCMYTSM